MINEYVWQKKYAAYSGETFDQGVRRVTEAMQVPELAQPMRNLQFSPAGRVWFGAGKPKAHMQNCALFDVQDSKEGWADLLHISAVSLMCGLGIGVSYDKIRPFGALIRGSGGTASGPISLMHMVNETARHIRQGNTRRAACYASLYWKHDDVLQFIAEKDWSNEIRHLKAQKYDAVAPLDIHNISVRYDPEFVQAYHTPCHSLHARAHEIFDAHMEAMFRTGEPGIQFDNDDQIYRNGCTEVISDQHGDSCTLGSLNLAAIDDLTTLQEVTHLAVRLLMNVRLQSAYPTEQMRNVALGNMRIGLGYFGLHNWLLKRGFGYAPNAELSNWLTTWQQTAHQTAREYAYERGVPTPVAVLSVAPTGSISTLYGGVAGGLEPILSEAYLRRYQDGTEQAVVDPTVQALLDQGVLSADAEIDSAYTLATPDGFVRRLMMQTFLQSFVDNAMSNTINLPSWGSPGNNTDTLPHYKQAILTYMPHLRGITVYPDGAIPFQPLRKLTLQEALDRKAATGSAYSTCSSGVCEL